MLNTLIYPLRSFNWIRKLAISWVVVFIGFFIPIVPHAILAGYCARIMRHILEDDELLLPDWNNLNELFKDGIKIFGAVFVYTFPILFAGLVFLMTKFLGTSPDLDPQTRVAQLENSMLMVWIFYTLALLVACVGLSVAIAHIVATDKFSAIFQFAKLWSIFRKSPIKFLFPVASLIGFILGWYVILFLPALLPINVEPRILRVVFVGTFLLFIISIPLMQTGMVIVFSILSAQAYRASTVIKSGEAP